MKYILVTFWILLLNACSSIHSFQNKVTEVVYGKIAREKIKYHDISDIVHVIGNPNQINSIERKTYYAWIHSREAGKSFAIFGNIAYQQHCNMTIEMEKNNIIYLKYSGNDCFVYLNKITNIENNLKKPVD